MGVYPTVSYDLERKEMMILPAVLERPKKVWVKPDHKLTHEEFEEILANWDYDPDYDDEYEEYNANGLPLIDDEFGNPTYGTFNAMYETRHGLTEPTTLDELLAWVDSL